MGNCSLFIILNIAYAYKHSSQLICSDEYTDVVLNDSVIY